MAFIQNIQKEVWQMKKVMILASLAMFAL